MCKYKVIIVDDDPWTLVDIRTCFPFREFNFSIVAECPSAESALSLIVQHRPELVITDIRMELGSGLDLIKKCKEKKIPSLFVILSGYDNFEYAKEAIKLGAFYYMLKPICDNEARSVLQQIEQHLANQEASEGTTKTASPEHKFDVFQEVLDYLETHSGETVTLDNLSQTFFLNRTYICDLFRKNLGKTFKQHLTEIRIRRARNLLKNSILPIGAVAQRVGYDDAHYFSRVFKAAMKVTPLDYRAAHSEEN